MQLPGLPGRRLLVRVPDPTRHAKNICYKRSLRLRFSLHVQHRRASLQLRLTVVCARGDGIATAGATRIALNQSG
jgi:hypothetical protein